MGIFRKYMFGLVLSLALVAASVAGIFLTRSYTYHGTLFDAPQAAPAISLTDQNNQPFDLAAHKGNIVLIFFGYTNCPDICPATMANLSQLYSRLGSQAKNVRVVFITVDPQRDTAPQLAQFLAKFNSAFIGLTGTEQVLSPIWKAYGVYSQTQVITGSSNYLEIHSDAIYLVDKAGRLRLTYDYTAPVSDLLSDVLHLLKEN